MLNIGIITDKEVLDTIMQYVNENYSFLNKKVDLEKLSKKNY